MRRGSKTLIVAAAIMLLAASLAACGGGDDDSRSTATEATAPGQTAEPSGGAASGGKADDGESSDAGGGGGSGGSSAGSGDFVPKQHDDSGGGAEQFRVEGGDNSVQEFGAEADTSDRDEAAAALHNFLDARAAGEWAAACSYLAKSVTESLEKLAAQAKKPEPMSCAVIFKKLTNPEGMDELRAEAAKADVGSLRIEEDRAFLLYRGVGGSVLVMPMAKEGGAWKVTSLAGTPIS